MLANSAACEDFLPHPQPVSAWAASGDLMIWVFATGLASQLPARRALLKKISEKKFRRH